MNIQTDLLDLSDSNVRRRKLLPWWIKIFIWIFLVFGVIVPVALLFGIMGKNFQISLYGIETNNPLSITGIGLLSIFLLKAFVAYGLWFEKEWAVKLGLMDAWFGLILSIIIFIWNIINPTNNFYFPIEIIFLIFYTLWLYKNGTKWITSNSI